MKETVTFHDLAGASVFITGGGSGIGASLTEGFLEQGAKVAFVQRSDATGFCDEMEEKYGNRPLFMPCDITDDAALKACIAQAAEAHGAVTCLVNNAANDKRHTTAEVDSDFFDWMIAINLKAYFFACQAVMPGMQAAGGGSIGSIPDFLSLSTAGMMVSISSSPRLPFSPACGLRPVKAMRGALTPKSLRNAVSVILAICVRLDGVKCLDTSSRGTWIVASETRNPPPTSIMTGRIVWFVFALQRSAINSVCPG